MALALGLVYLFAGLGTIDYGNDIGETNAKMWVKRSFDVKAGGVSAKSYVETGPQFYRAKLNRDVIEAALTAATTSAPINLKSVIPVPEAVLIVNCQDIDSDLKDKKDDICVEKWVGPTITAMFFAMSAVLLLVAWKGSSTGSFSMASNFEFHKMFKVLAMVVCLGTLIVGALANADIYSANENAAKENPNAPENISSPEPTMYGIIDGFFFACIIPGLWMGTMVYTWSKTPKFSEVIMEALM